MRTKVEFENGRGDKLAALHEVPAGDLKGWVLFAHCFTCSKDLNSVTQISHSLQSQGFGVLRFDFTGLGQSGGDFGNTNFSSNVEDLLMAAEFLRQHHEAPKLIVGHSLGGAAVLVAAGQIPEVQAVATIGAPSDVEHVAHLFEDKIEDIEKDGQAKVILGGRPFTIKKSFIDDLNTQNVLSRVEKLNRPLMIFHSPIDNIVSIEHAKEIYNAAKHPKSFVSLDNADHLLLKPADARYVGTVLGAWASRYVKYDKDAIKPLTEGHVLVEETGIPFQQKIRAGAHQFVADEPPSVGGKDTGPTPYDLLLAGLGACTSMTLRMYARHKGIPLETISVELNHAKVHAKDCEDCESKTGMIDEINRTISVTGDLTSEQREKLLTIADKCPVHRTLENEIKIRTKF